MCKRHAMALFIVLLATLAAASCRPLLAAEPASTVALEGTALILVKDDLELVVAFAP